ncbi:MAG TPA: DUF892 family protein [Verrucomicrobiae bacterium]|jgi:ferritin-like metal-binding protein YciE|nr:DUF892 family protein [Verrucomicrobiae bacterium]
MISRNTAPASRVARTTPINDRLSKLFEDQLANLKSAEHQLTFAIPILEAAAKSKDLKTLLHIHLEETKGHLATVKQVADSLEVKLPGKTCKGMKGLIKEAVGILIHALHSDDRDNAIIAAAQKIEHYEIASYGTLCAWAAQLGYTHEGALLASTLSQEKMADTLLTGVARGKSLEKLVKNTSLQRMGAKIKP